MIRSLARLLDIWYTLFFVGMGAALAALGAAFLAFQLVELLFGGPILSDPTFYLAAALSGLFIGPPLWWCSIIKPRRLTLKRGILVGSLGSVVAHPLTWFFIWLFSLTHRESVGIGDPVFLSLVSLLFVGWITTPIGAVAGGVLAAIQRQLHCQARWSAAL